MRLFKTRWLLTIACVTAVAGCGGSDGDGGNEPPPDEDPLVVQQAPTSDGDAQTGPVGAALPDPLRIIITRASEPQEGVDVTWSAGQGGSVAPEVGVTGADGIASTAWTLGPDEGPHTATATVADAEGSPVTFTATAEGDDEPPPPPPPPADATIQVLGPPGPNRFDPAAVTIQAGETVAWVWGATALSHNVRPDETEPTASGAPANGPNEYRFTFTTAGTYRYHCGVHGAPGGVGMSGTVIVEP
jgi:plastocyanin